MNEAQVTQHQPLASATALPKELTEYLQARNLRYSFQFLDDRTEMELEMAGMEPLEIEDLKESLPELHAKLVKKSRRHEDGLLHRGDAVLCVQPLELHKQEQEREAHIRRLQHSGEKAKEELSAYMEGELGYDPIEGSIEDLQVDVSKQLLDLPRRQA